MVNKRATGSEYEQLAVDYLRNKGYIILETNYRIRQSEIDIIARENNTVVFVEVKYRSCEGSGNPVESVGINKQRRICRAAKEYIFFNGISFYESYRFDVIAILKDKITHIETAFMFIE